MGLAGHQNGNAGRGRMNENSIGTAWNKGKGKCYATGITTSGVRTPTDAVDPWQDAFDKRDHTS